MHRGQARSHCASVGNGRRLDGKLVGQAHERGQVQLLGTQAAIDAGSFDLGIAQQRLERVAQGLAALVKRLANDALQQFVILGRVWQ